jgi:hypothetical protein
VHILNPQAPPLSSEPALSQPLLAESSTMLLLFPTGLDGDGIGDAWALWLLCWLVPCS